MFKSLLGLRRLKVVRLQFANLASQIIGHHVEPEVALHRGVACVFGTTLITTLFGVHDRLFDGVALFIQDVVKCIGDFLEDPIRIAFFEQILTSLFQFAAHLAQSLHPLAVRVGRPALHQTSQSPTQIAILQQIIRHFVEEITGLKVEARLGAIPT